MLSVGIRSSSLRPKAVFADDALLFAKELGFELVELSFNHPAGALDHEDRDAAKRIRQQADELAVRLTAHAPDDIVLTSPDERIVAAAIDRCREVLVGAAAYGVRTLVLHACPYQPVVSGQEQRQMDHLIGSLHSLESLCRNSRIHLAVETMVPGRISSSIDRLITAVDAVDSPWVGICLDTNHLNLSCNLCEAIRKAGRRIIEFHLNDNHGETEEHLLPYDGLIDWDAFFEAVREIDYQGDMILEPSWRSGESHEAMCRKAREVALCLEQELQSVKRE